MVLNNCGHYFCKNCWYNFLSVKINGNKLTQIKCLEYECQEKLPIDFIMNIIKDNKELIVKVDINLNKIKNNSNNSLSNSYNEKNDKSEKKNEKNMNKKKEKKDKNKKNKNGINESNLKNDDSLMEEMNKFYSNDNLEFDEDKSNKILEENYDIKLNETKEQLIKYTNKENKKLIDLILGNVAAINAESENNNKIDPKTFINLSNEKINNLSEE